MGDDEYFSLLRDTARAAALFAPRPADPAEASGWLHSLEHTLLAKIRENTFCGTLVDRYETVRLLREYWRAGTVLLLERSIAARTDGGNNEK